MYYIKTDTNRYNGTVKSITVKLIAIRYDTKHILNYICDVWSYAWLSIMVSIKKTIGALS